ncbi:hypothetical protein ACFXKJ_41655, partial [Kitasatospora indigofera]
GYDCNTSNGFLCIKRTGAHAHASYLNQGSSTKYIQLWIWCSTGQWRSKAVNVRPGQLVYADYDAPGGQDGFYPICGASILDARNVPPTGIINTRQV